MKKILCALVLIISVMCVLASCNSSDLPDETTATTLDETTTTTPEETTPEETTPEEILLTTPGLAYEVNYDGKTCTITGIGVCTESDIVIGNYIDGYEITTIDAYAFSYCTNLTSVTIGNSVTRIGEGAFGACTNLTSVTIGDSVTIIGHVAFQGCNLTSVIIPDSVTRIGTGVFSDCSNLTSVTIGGSVTTIDGSAFTACNRLTSIVVDQENTAYQSIDGNLYSKDGTVLVAYAIGKANTSFAIPNSVTSVGWGAFLDCTNLTSITIPDSVIFIGGCAFQGCTNLTSVTIPDSVTTIRNHAFRDCDNLTSITIPDSVTTIDCGAFEDCSSLTNVTIGNSVTTIDDDAFKDCSSLTNVTIGNSVTTIGNGAFRNCTNLTSVTIPDSVLYIHYDAFYGCDNRIYNEYGNAYYLGNKINPYKYLAKAKSTDIKSCIIHQDTKVIFDYVFSNCKNLTSVTIGDSVTTIGHSTFSGCYSLTSVTIGDSVTTIGYSMFSGCYSLTSVTLGASVTTIEDYAFDGCYKLVEVINKSSLTITAGSRERENGSVGYYAKEVHNGTTKIVTQNNYLFYTYDGVNYLLGYVGTDTALTLPENYNGQNYEIYKYAFYRCTNLTSVTIGDSVITIGRGAFEDCTNLTSVTLGASVTTIDDYAFEHCYKLVEVINKSSLTITAGSRGRENGYVGYYAKEVHNGTTKIVNQNNYLFYTYDGVNYLLGYVGTDTALTLPENYNGQNYEIYQYAFYRCTNLTSVTIPDSVTNIGYYAFSGCDNLIYNEYDNAYYLGNKTNPYIYLAKAKSTEIKSCIIHQDAKVIGGGAFNWCGSLTSVTIGDSVTTIGDSAFSRCDSLTSITFKGTVEQWNAISKGSWNFSTGKYTIYCTDGTIAKDGIVTLN